MSRKLIHSVFIGALLLVGSGCGINLYAGRASDVTRIAELSTKLEQLQAQKSREANQLQEAKNLLEERLRSEISNNQVKLEMAERGLVLTFVAEVLFDSGRSTLKKSAKQALSKVAQVISEKVADREIGIEGHTDNDPIKKSGWKSNWELSTGRATSVLHYLEEEGVNPGSMVASGYGEYRPVVENDSKDGRMQNRRVEIVILPKQFTRAERELIRQAQASGAAEVIEQAQVIEEFK